MELLTHVILPIATLYALYRLFHESVTCYMNGAVFWGLAGLMNFGSLLASYADIMQR